MESGQCLRSDLVPLHQDAAIYNPQQILVGDLPCDHRLRGYAFGGVWCYYRPLRYGFRGVRRYRLTYSLRFDKSAGQDADEEDDEIQPGEGMIHVWTPVENRFVLVYDTLRK